jgi:molecular chaperone DnaK
VSGESKRAPLEGLAADLSPPSVSTPAPKALTDLEWGAMFPGEEPEPLPRLAEPPPPKKVEPAPKKTEPPPQPTPRVERPPQKLEPPPKMPEPHSASADLLELAEVDDEDLLELPSVDVALSDIPDAEPDPERLPVPMLAEPSLPPSRVEAKTDSIKILTDFELTGEPGRPDLDDGLLYVAPPPLPSKTPEIHPDLELDVLSDVDTLADVDVLASDPVLHPPRDISEIAHPAVPAKPTSSPPPAPLAERSSAHASNAQAAAALASHAHLASPDAPQSTAVTSHGHVIAPEAESAPRAQPKPPPERETKSAPSAPAKPAEEARRARARPTPAPDEAVALPGSGSPRIKTEDISPVADSDEERAHPTLGQGGFHTKSGRFVALPDPASTATPAPLRSNTGRLNALPDPEKPKIARHDTAPPRAVLDKIARPEAPRTPPPKAAPTPMPRAASGGSAPAKATPDREPVPPSDGSRPRPAAYATRPPPAPAAFVEPSSPPPAASRPHARATSVRGVSPIPYAPTDPIARGVSQPSFTPIPDLDMQARSEGFLPATEPSEPIKSRYRKKIPPLPAKGDIIVGIDLGTTYSCAALVDAGGRAQVLASRRGTGTIPSVVCFLPGGKALVGESALKLAANNPKTTVIGSKRLVGRPFHSPIVQEIRDHFAYDIVQGEDGEAAIRIDERIVSLEEVSALILQEIRESASLQVEGKVNRAVITCPAHFNERQREAVRVAGELAGFHVERILSEPTAAALNFGFGKALSGHKVLIYDLGGGTFDVSILEVHDEVYEVLATGGDTFLGGIDFDACVTELLVEHFLEAEQIDARTDPTAIARIFHYAEQAKRELSERPTTIVQIDHLVVQPFAARALTLPVRRSRVEEMWDPLVSHTIDIVKEVCARAKLEPKDIDDVILVGGQSRSPIIHKKVAEFFGKPPNRSLHPDEAIALGAAQYAASLTSFDSIVLIDALPMSIGVGLPGGRYKKIIERDTRLPAERHYQLRTTRDNQETFEILLFQGEDERVENNEPLGMLHLSGMPPGQKGSVSVLVTMKVTAECILELTAREMKTGKTVKSKLGTKDTPEALRAKLGLPPKPVRTTMNRNRLVTNQPKGVWSWLTKLFKRDR